MSCTGKGLAENVNTQLLISMTNGDISKGFNSEEAPHAAKLQISFYILKVFQTVQKYWNDFVRNVLTHPFRPAASQIKKMKKLLLDYFNCMNFYYSVISS